jgi:hypothetical protein
VSGEPGAIKVLFIGGYGRSGSTLLDHLLGEVDGFFSAGELRHVFQEGYLENRLCGCGAPFRECGFWRQVTEEAFGGMESFDVAELIRVKNRVDRYWRVPQLISGMGTPGRRADLSWYLGRLRSLYEAIGSVSGASVIVDSSKDVSHGYVLNAIGPPVEPYVCHLVRDSRAVAHSWARPKFNPGNGSQMNRYGPVRTSAEWVAINALTRLQRHVNPDYRLLRYGELATGPELAVRQILELVGEDGRTVPLIDGRRFANGGTHHTVAGNPDRFRRGEIEIRWDQSWRAGMPVTSRSVVTALTWPTLLRYGFVGSRAGRPAPESRRRPRG